MYAANPSVIGRDDVLADMAQRLRAAETDGSSLLITGEPGIGKTALVGWLGQRAREHGFIVLETAGAEFEAHLPYAGLEQLVARHVRTHGHVLPPGQQAALAAAFGVGRPARPEPMLTALAALHLLNSLARNRPLALLVDDAQWLDPQTVDVVTLMARRQPLRHVLLAATVRAGHDMALTRALDPALRIGPLTEGASLSLLKSARGLEGLDARLVQQQAQGNPLALLELPPTQWARQGAPATHEGVPSSASKAKAPSADRPERGTSPSRPGPLGSEILDSQPELPSRLQYAFSNRLRSLPQVTQAAMLACAIDPVANRVELERAVHRLSADTSQIDAGGRGMWGGAIDASLIRVSGDLVEFRHPLVRSAVLADTALAQRQVAHAALADAVSDPYRSAWHRGQAIIGPDEKVAQLLVNNAERDLGRGAVQSAIMHLKRAAQLSPEPAVRGHRLLVAAQHAFDLGDAATVEALTTQASAVELSQADRDRLEWIREAFDSTPGDATRVAALAAIAEERWQDDPDFAFDVLLSAALGCWWADTGPTVRAKVSTAARCLGSAVTRPDRAGTDPRAIAAAAVSEPILACSYALDALNAWDDYVTAPGNVCLPGARPEELLSPDDFRLMGMAAHAVGDEQRATRLLDRAEAPLRDQGRVALLSQVLSMQVGLRLELGDLEGAARAINEGQRLAIDTGQPIWSAGTLVCHARYQALAGDADRALALAAKAELEAAPRRLNDLLACVQLARGTAHLAADRPADAFMELRRLFDPTDASHHHREKFAGIFYLAEAAQSPAHKEIASAILQSLEVVAGTTPSPLLHINLAAAQAVLASPPDAEERFASARHQDLRQWPWVRARLDLAYARHLMSIGRDSADLAATAIKAMSALGVPRWATGLPNHPVSPRRYPAQSRDSA